ncbi:MAG: YkgJ family cysteine cluster protein [Burkholderiales bacterium]|nr:YkgJ family cysteine cluster protein [Burkholderiales bacterium]
MSIDIPLPPPPESGQGQPEIKEYSDPSPMTPVQPVQLGPEDRFQFNCHKGIACFNKCCQNIDIMLAPYDILRLKKRLGLSSRDFIDNFTRDFAMDGHGMPGLKLATKDESPACAFLTPEGCGVYADRPSACRYYALGLLSMRRKDSPTDEDSYFVVKEDHCLGHEEPKTQTVRDYRKEQGLEDYDAINREWRQIVLKKRSSGPTIGKPSERSMELFFLASYDLDGFRDFISTPGFTELFELDPAEKELLLATDEALLRFAFRFLKQALYGEISIPVRADAADKRRERYRQRVEQMEREAVERKTMDQDAQYESLKYESQDD